MASRVVVIHEDSLARNALQHPDMLVGERGSLARDGVCKAGRMKTDAVDLPFADYHFAVRILADCARGAVKAEEDV